jgi:predicted nucleotidyltransferase
MKSKPFPISQAKIEDFCTRWSIKEFALFGSVLRDDFHPQSDVDILITLGPNNRLTLDNRFAMMDELAEIFGRPVDLVEKRHLRNPFRRHAILTTKKVIYAA